MYPVLRKLEVLLLCNPSIKDIPSSAWCLNFNVHQDWYHINEIQIQYTQIKS